ncbi:arsenite methyltransferase [Salmo salar]|uniref:Arsenite methyltransferase n=1 Tax=Salmo salar TaxID=8030 RepID=A0A1S3LRQ1_SALSA|nr:arsenite methyltransferase-like [Salmo salar]|eukprot:XP_013993541.1 PREDICTED: arsenite methyltransferase-like [Salmo salar]
METLEYHELVQRYYGSRLEIHGSLKTSASCMSPSTPIPQSTFDALRQVHPSVCKKYSGCGLVVPEKLQGCKVLDLGSGSGRDCFILSKLVGQSGHVIGIDMTAEQILASRKYVQYHQEKYGYEKPNTIFVQGYIEKLNETGIQSGSLDVLVSNCAMCLCPDKKPVLREAFRVLKEGGELYFSDIYSSKAVPEHLKQDPVLWGEGLSGALYWRDLISLVHEVGFSTPYLLTASHIIVHNSELQKKASGITHTSATYRLFKLPKNRKQSDAVVAYKGTVPDHPDLLKFDMYHCFETDIEVTVDAEMAAVLQHSRFSSDFSIQSSDKPAPSPKCTPQSCHLNNPFLLADNLKLHSKPSTKIGNTGEPVEKYDTTN